MAGQVLHVLDGDVLGEQVSNVNQNSRSELRVSSR